MYSNWIGVRLTAVEIFCKLNLKIKKNQPPHTHTSLNLPTCLHTMYPGTERDFCCCCRQCYIYFLYRLKESIGKYIKKKLKIKAYFCCCCYAACCCYVFYIFTFSPFFPHLWTCESWTLISLESISGDVKSTLVRLMAKGMLGIFMLRNQCLKNFLAVPPTHNIDYYVEENFLLMFFEKKWKSPLSPFMFSMFLCFYFKAI